MGSRETQLTAALAGCFQIAAAYSDSSKSGVMLISPTAYCWQLCREP
ncbi:MAG: hypothetical protein DSM106950_20860 [Stigonema ocellatum SAG 48.90 = DSM 106950]|nr:hypothetical protein [Stigonema ocellatum SAG 48.90 = DSM 106950]